MQGLSVGVSGTTMGVTGTGTGTGVGVTVPGITGFSISLEGLGSQPDPAPLMGTWKHFPAEQ